MSRRTQIAIWAAASIPLLAAAGGLLAMRRGLRPVAGALVTPRSPSLRYQLIVGAPPLPAITPERPLDQEAPGWVVLGWTRGRDSERIAQSAMAYAGAAIRCTRPAPACDGAAPPEEGDVSLCAEGQPLRRLRACGFDDCERLTLLTFVQRSTQVDLDKLRQTCRGESDRWQDWNPPPRGSEGRR
jgi:hypothetical protein